MVIDMTEDCRRLTVHAVNFGHRSGPVFYTSLPCGSPAADIRKHLLVSALWDHFVAIESPLWKRGQFSGRAAFPVQVVRGLLGRPQLLLGEYQGPSISFSEGGGNVWAALCGDESDIGIDVAGPDEFKCEFPNEYPFHRVFHAQELQHALRLAGGDLEKAAALLWSVKEAVVKALGCAFHLVDPFQITVYPSAEGGCEGALRGTLAEDGGYTFQVGLSGKAPARFALAAGSLSVRSLSRGKLWLSIAFLKQRSAGRE